ncbi:MAG: TetR/AcrR family transcriptional regulator [Pseudomonadota bacterium]
MSSTDIVSEKPGRRAQAKAANRAAILTAAKRVFARLGYDATSVRDIIRETDLAAGTFYNYFRSKEDIFDAISDDSAKQFRPRLQAVQQSAKSFEEYIAGAYFAFFSFLAEESQETRQGPFIPIGSRADTPEIQAVFEEIRSHLDFMIMRGDVPPVDTRFLTAAAIGIARDLGDQMLQRDPVDPKAAADFAVNLFLGGLAAVVSNGSDCSN